MSAAIFVILRTFAACVLGFSALVAFAVALVRDSDPLMAGLHGLPWLLVAAAIVPSRESRAELAAQLEDITRFANDQADQADQEKGAAKKP